MKYYLKIGIYIVFLWGLSISLTAAEGKWMTLPLGGEIEVTSDFGWREHPIFGTQKFHSGVDLAAEEGQPVYAAANGIVSTAGWISGYGNTVILGHGDGLETVYAHNLEVTVWEGAFIEAGTVIALAGSTGNSTGPHCHFEVDLNGEAVDPWEYVNGTARPSSDPSSFFQSDFNFLPIDFSASVDFAKPLRDVLTALVTACTNGLAFLQNSMKYFFWALVTIDFAYAAFWGLFKTNYNPRTGQGSTAKSYIHWLLQRMLFYSILAAIAFNWQNWFIHFILNFFSSMGSTAMGASNADVGAIISDPTMIVQKGISLIAPVFSYLGDFSGPMALLNIGTIVPCLLIAFAILGCFLLVGIQIGCAYVEFYIVSLFGFTMFCFSGLENLRRYGAHAINAVIAVGIKLMFFCMFSVMLTFVLQNLTINDYFAQGSLQSAQDHNQQKFNASSSNIKIEQFMAAIRQVETGGEADPYNAEAMDGYGFGAYQISYENWDNWCATAGLETPAEWTPENQDKVARNQMLMLYETYGNWHDVAIAWNGGDGAVGQGWGSTEGYAAKVEKAIGEPLQKQIKIILLLEMLFFSALFIFFADKASDMIMQLFGGSGGFQFTTFSGENDKHI